MLSLLRRRFTWANVAMSLVLVFAMTGGAYAAKRYVITSTKQISPSVLKQLKGAGGPAGKQGPQGPGGAIGASGSTGAIGPEGKPGLEGKLGLEGKPGPKGEPGEPGPAGEPWPVGGLPKGATEMGEWAVSQHIVLEKEEVAIAPISFTVPLTKSLGSKEAHFIKPGEGEGEGKEAPAITSHECGGTYKEPKAASGQLCVFARYIVGQDKGEEPIIEGVGGTGADRAGTQLNFDELKPEGTQFVGAGSWAVTG